VERRLAAILAADVVGYSRLMGVLVVTGGSRGFGAAICKLAAQRGWSVCVNYERAAEAASKVVADIKSSNECAIAVQADVANPKQVESMFQVVDKELGPVTGLVNNAGIMGSRGRVEDLVMEYTSRMLAVNVLGAFLCCQAAIKRMAKRHGGLGGNIVNISSASSRHGGAGSYVDFAASKAALDTLTTGLAKEQAGEGIRVNCVRPGFIMTEGNQQWMADHPGWYESVIARTPMGRAGELNDVATAAIWLLSEEAQFVTGAIVDVSGGFVTP
jgi:NAD(P)-dependent dehydrogenase (short-subunit alcohol dehydrogenase family)